MAGAAFALGYVYNMEKATVFSAETYNQTMQGMINDEMHWGSEFDQQQRYVDVYGTYAGLVDGSLSASLATADLEGIKANDLVPWLQEDLNTLSTEWQNAATQLIPEPTAAIQHMAGFAGLLALSRFRALRKRKGPEHSRSVH
jgi:hypothetical protein